MILYELLPPECCVLAKSEMDFWNFLENLNQKMAGGYGLSRVLVLRSVEIEVDFGSKIFV